MEFKYLLLSVIFVVFATPHYSYSAAAWTGHRYKFVPSILIPDRIIQRLEQRQKSFRCTSEGYFADPNDCTKFYRCVPNPGSPNYFDQYSFECPPGTAFDDSIKTCNFISAVPGCEGTTSSPSKPGLQPTTSTTAEPTQTLASTTISTFPSFSTDSTTTQDSLGVTGTTLTSIDSTTTSSTISEEVSTETVASAESTTERPSSTTTDGTTVTILDSTTTKVTTETITDSSTESTTTERTTTTDSSDITGTTTESSATIEPTPDSSGSIGSTLEESSTMEVTTDSSTSDPITQGSTEETSTAVSSLEITGTTPTLIGSTPTESSTAESTTEITTINPTTTTSPIPTIIEFTDEFTPSTESATLIPPSLTLDMSTTIDPLETTENTVSTIDSSAYPSTLPPLPSLAELLTLVDCAQDSSGMMDLSLKRVPNNCNIFYQCVFNEGAKPGISLFSCPAGQLFDEPSATCKNPGDTTPCLPPIVPPQPTGNMTAEFSDLASQLCQDETFHRFPTNCNFFFQCLKSGSAYKLHLFACPGGLVYDEPTATCQTPENSTPCRNPDELSTPSSILFTLMPASQYNCIIPGNFPYELDCDHFYRCFEVLPGVLNGLLYQCPVGYSFSTVSERCELKTSQPFCQRRRPNDRRRFPTGGIRLNVQDLPFFFRY